VIDNYPDNSRRFERAVDTIAVNYRVVDFEKGLDDFGEGMTASTLELSAGGMKLRMSERFAPRTLLDLRYKLRSDGKEITVLSVVVQTEPSEYEGMFYTVVEYPMLSDADRAEVDHYVKELNKRRGN
jgi:c-di-GMP-binding flagellar brake protein YcgR